MTDHQRLPRQVVAPVTIEAMVALGMLEAMPDDPDMVRITSAGMIICATLLTIYIICDKSNAFDMIAQAKKAARDLK